MKADRIGNFVGMPAAIRLDAFAARVFDAFGDVPYQVGSSLNGRDWRDVDVRLILDDDEFADLFPDYAKFGQLDPKWALLCDALSEIGRQMTGLPIDFQIQSQTHANEKHPGPRNALGLRFTKEST